MAAVGQMKARSIRSSVGHTRNRLDSRHRTPRRWQSHACSLAAAIRCKWRLGLCGAVTDSRAVSWGSAQNSRTQTGSECGHLYHAIRPDRGGQRTGRPKGGHRRREAKLARGRRRAAARAGRRRVAAHAARFRPRRSAKRSSISPATATATSTTRATAASAKSRWTTLRRKMVKVAQADWQVIQDQFARNRVDVVCGEASFVDPHRVEVAGRGERQIFEAEHILLAPGTRPGAADAHSVQRRNRLRLRRNPQPSRDAALDDRHRRRRDRPRIRHHVRHAGRAGDGRRRPRQLARVLRPRNHRNAAAPRPLARHAVPLGRKRDRHSRAEAGPGGRRAGKRQAAARRNGAVQRRPRRRHRLLCGSTAPAWRPTTAAG